jgi:hypothetical protein
MRTAKKAGLPERLPRAVLALCWALAAMHWRTHDLEEREKGYAGATYAGLRVLLGVSSRTRLHALVSDAVKARVVTMKQVTVNRVARPVVMLRKTTLQQLEALWT